MRFLFPLWAYLLSRTLFRANIFSCHTVLLWANSLWLTLSRVKPTMQILKNFLTSLVILRGGADKSLAGPTSRYNRTESVVSLEWGDCSCAELLVFFCYRGWKKACQATRAISTTSRCELSSGILFQGKTPKEIHAILIETLGELAPSYATVKNWVAQFKRGDFSSCDAPRPGRPKTVTTQEIIDQIHELFLEGRRISAKSHLVMRICNSFGSRYRFRRKQLLLCFISWLHSF
jgi:transposase